MDRIERAVVRECFRELHKNLGFPNQTAAAAGLVDKDKTISKPASEKYVKGQPTSSLEKMSQAALDILKDHHSILRTFYEHKDASALNFIEAILQKYRSVMSHRISNVVFNNWGRPSKKGRDAFSTGIYQIYRRYKPTRTELQHNPLNAEDHSVVCEILFANSETMECMLITCQRNIYYGTLHINEDGILCGIVQRQNEEKTGYHQRLFSAKLEVALPMYSAIMIKTGDTMGKPVSSECIYIGVPRDSNADLYQAVEQFAADPWKVERVDRDSVIMDYISFPPDKPRGHPDLAFVKYVRDFPVLAAMAREPRVGKALLREPSRTLSPDTIMYVSTTHGELGVFRHSTFQVSPARRGDPKPSRSKARRPTPAGSGRQGIPPADEQSPSFLP